MMYDIIIIGAGPAGLTAAVYAARAGKSVLVLEKSGIGGQIAYSRRIENYPAISKISGSEFSDNLFEQAMALGAQWELCEVLSVKDGDVKTVVTDSGEFTAKSVIIATGVKNRPLGIEGEEFISGVSYCAVCDGTFYKDGTVAVCGGGSTALQSALYLSEICKKVYLIHRRDEFRGEVSLQKEIAQRANIECLMSSKVTALIGEDSLSAITVTKDGAERDISVSALFVAYGKVPENSIFAPLINLSEDGYIIAGEDCKTNVEGIYAAGDCRTKQVRQLTTAAADGTVAAINASKL